MNSHLPQNPDERLELALSGLRTRRIAKFPNVQIDFPAEPMQPSLPVLPSRRHRPAIRRIAAAVLCVALGVALLNVRGGGAGVVLAEVIQSAVRAESVSFVMREQTNGQTSKEVRCWLQGDRLRIEGPGDSTWIESGTGAIMLDRKSKQATRVPTSTAIRNDPVPSPIEQLRRARSDIAKFVGEEEIDGRQTSKFQMGVQDVSLFHDGEMYGFGAEFELIVWIDVETQLPLRIEIRHPQEPARIVFEQLKWNEELDSSLFDTTIPSGFSERSERRRDR